MVESVERFDGGHSNGVKSEGAAVPRRTAGVRFRRSMPLGLHPWQRHSIIIWMTLTIPRVLFLVAVLEPVYLVIEVLDSNDTKKIMILQIVVLAMHPFASLVPPTSSVDKMHARLQPRTIGTTGADSKKYGQVIPLTEPLEFLKEPPTIPPHLGSLQHVLLNAPDHHIDSYVPINRCSALFACFISHLSSSHLSLSLSLTVLSPSLHLSIYLSLSFCSISCR